MSDITTRMVAEQVNAEGNQETVAETAAIAGTPEAAVKTRKPGLTVGAKLDKMFDKPIKYLTILATKLEARALAKEAKAKEALTAKAAKLRETMAKVNEKLALIEATRAQLRSI